MTSPFADHLAYTTMTSSPVKPTTQSSRADLTTSYQLLVNDRLPHAAKTRSPTQAQWPVHLNHCFGRIILDNICERPWKEVIKSPATRNMSMDQLERCVELGEAILSGEADLQRLNEKSLEWRGKAGENKGGKKDKAVKTESRTTSSTASKRKLHQVEPVLNPNPKRTKTQSKSIQDYFVLKSTTESDDTRTT